MPPLLLAALSLVQLLTSSHILSAKGQTQPSAIGDAISKIMAILTNGGINQPGAVEKILADLVDAMKAATDILPPEVAAKIASVQDLLDRSEASISNLASGQVAQVVVVSMSFDGVEVPVDVFALRQDSKNSVAVDLGLA